MRYVGGKGKIAKDLVAAIAAHTELRARVYEPFMGGGAVTASLAGLFSEISASDGHEDIAMMWGAVLDGWVPPAIEYDQYQELRYSGEPSALRGFAGSGCSFGGRWFEGFARGGVKANGEPRNHQEESVRAVLRDAQQMQRATVSVTHALYEQIELPDHPVVIYCDPPYAASTKDYKVGGFASNKFWQVAASWAAAGHHVFVSEYEAPAGWTCIWSKEKRQSLVVGSGVRELRVERLFVYGDGYSSVDASTPPALFELEPTA